jgi:excisionase family DNA binding protein
VPKAPRTAPDPELFIDAEEVARRIGLSRSWVYDAADRKLIPSYRFGNRRRFLISEVEAWMTDSKVDPTPRPKRAKR